MAQAATPVVSQGEGRLLTAELLNSSIDALLALNGAKAVDPYGLANVTSNVALDATALSLIAAQVNGINLFGDGGIIRLGAVGQYAGANNDASSVAFSGTVSQAESLVGVGTVVTGSNVGTPGAGDSASINVGTTQILGGADLVNLQVGIGAVAASAHQTSGGAQSGEFVVANLDVVVGGTVLGGVIDLLNAELDLVIALLNTLIDPDVINPLAGGQLTITLDDLLAAAGVASINDLAPGTNLLSFLPAAVVTKLTSVVNNLLSTINTAVAGLGVLGLPVQALLTPAEVVIAGILGGLAGTLAGPLGLAVDALLQLDVNTKTTTAGAFTETALTVGVGTSGALARVGLANATVGPNAGIAGIPPHITGLAPTSGPESGGTSVVITGSSFTTATGVLFGTTPATSFTVDSDTQITAVSPAHVPATVGVTVSNPVGTSNPGDFTFTPLISVTNINPNFGPVAGGTVVDIFGTCFTGATGVTFDGIAGTSFTVVDATHIQVTTPAHAAGAVNVVVQGSIACGGNTTVVGGFTYVPASAPTITGMVPDNGPESGGTPVTITGTGFTTGGTATGVTFDGIPATAFVVVNDTTITAVSPAHAPGLVGVIVQHPAANSGPFDFTYTPLISITNVNPNFGPVAGGTSVTITGTCFLGATGVTIGGNTVAAAAFTTHTDTSIVFNTPAHAVGAVDIVVHGSVACGGDKTLANAFTYIGLSAPVITGITPNSGPQTGGTAVTITGSGFTGATSATFGGVTGTSFTVVNDTTITVVTPPHAVGLVDVVVVHPTNGPSAPLGFTYLPATTVGTVDPGTGPEAGGTTVTITGTCFIGATAVRFGTTPATSFRVVNDTTIIAVSPAGVGTVGVTVVGNQTCGTATRDGAFRYLPTLAITGVNVLPVLAGALGLVLVGLTLALVRRRRNGSA